MRKNLKIMSVVLAVCLMLQITAISSLAAETAETIIAPLTDFTEANNYTNGQILGKTEDMTNGGFKNWKNYFTISEAKGVFGKDSNDSAYKAVSTSNSNSKGFPIAAIEGISNFIFSDGDYAHFHTQIAMEKAIGGLYLELAAKDVSDKSFYFEIDKTMFLSKYATAGDINNVDGKNGNSVIFNTPISVYLEEEKWYNLDVVIERTSSGTTASIYLDNVLIGTSTQTSKIKYISTFKLGSRFGLINVSDGTPANLEGVGTYYDNISMTKYSGYTTAPAAIAALQQGTYVISAKDNSDLKRQYNTFYAVSDMTVEAVLDAISVPEDVSVTYIDSDFAEISDKSATAENGYLKTTDSNGTVTYYSMLTDIVLGYDDFSDNRFAPILSKYIHQTKKVTFGDYKTEYISGVSTKDAADYALKYYSESAKTTKYDFYLANTGYGWDAYDTMPLVLESDVMFTGDYDALEINAYGSGSSVIAWGVFTGKLTKNEWHRVSMVYSGTSAYMYIDGELISNGTTTDMKNEPAKFRYSLGVSGAPSEGVSTEIYVDNVKQYYADKADFFDGSIAKANIADFVELSGKTSDVIVDKDTILVKQHMDVSAFLNALQTSENVAETKLYSDNIYSAVVSEGKTADGQVLVLTTNTGAKKYYTVAEEKTAGTVTFSTSVDETSGSTKITASAEVVTNKSIAPFVLIFAEFNGTKFDRIIDMITGDAAVNGNVSKTVSYDESKTYKAFIFDSISTIKPLGGCAEYNVAQ